MYKNGIIIYMNILSGLLVGLGLSMDNFAVTIAAGCCHRKKLSFGYAASVSAVFSLAHFVMFGAGWMCGAAIGGYISSVDHWLAFAILAYIGGHMIYSSRKEEPGPDVCAARTLKTLLMLSVATSMDALAVGVGLALTDASFWLTAGMLCVCVWVTGWAGFYLGAWLGRRFGKWMETLGGTVLACIGIKLLLEGVGIW